MTNNTRLPGVVNDVVSAEQVDYAARSEYVVEITIKSNILSGDSSLFTLSRDAAGELLRQLATVVTIRDWTKE